MSIQHTVYTTKWHDNPLDLNELRVEWEWTCNISGNILEYACAWQLAIAIVVSTRWWWYVDGGLELGSRPIQHRPKNGAKRWEKTKSTTIIFIIGRNFSNRFFSLSLSRSVTLLVCACLCLCVCVWRNKFYSNFSWKIYEGNLNRRGAKYETTKQER